MPEIWSMKQPLSEAERLNLVAAALTEGWGFVPLHVRFEAAKLADDAVASWAAALEKGTQA